MIEEVELVDWKSHRDTTIEFRDGVNALVGEMGSGKSAVLEAITYGLYGTTPAVQDRRITLADLIRREPVEQEEAEVMVAFRVEGHRFTVERTLHREKGTTESMLRQDGDLIAGPQATEVTGAIEDLLGIDYELFSRVVYAEQNGIDDFLDLAPSDRKDRIDGLLHLQQYEDARSTCVSVRNRAQTQQEAKREQLDQVREDIGDIDAEDLDEELEEVGEDLEELEDDLDDRRERLEEVKDELDALEDRKEAHEERKEQVQKLSGRIDAMNEDIDDEERPDADSVTDELEGLREELDVARERLEEREELEERREKLAVQVGTLEDRIDELEERVEAAEGLEDVEDELEEVTEDLQEAQEAVATQQERLEKAGETLGTLDGADSTCPTCGQELDDEHRTTVIEEAEQSRDEAAERIDALGDRIDELKDRKDELEDRRKELSRYQGAADDLEERRDDLETIQDQIEELDGDIEEYDIDKDDIEELEDRIEELKDQEELAERFDELDELQERLEGEQEALEDTDFDPEAFEELREERGDLKSSVSTLEERRERFEERIGTLEDRKERLEELEERAEGLEDEIDQLDEIRDFLETFESALESTQVQLREAFIEQSNETMQELWSAVYPYDDYQSIRLNAAEDYRLELQDGRGGWHPVAGHVSGGERHAAALTVRITLTRVLAPDVRVLILDEPTHNLDDRAVDELARMLREQVADLVEQLIVITHDEGLETAVTGSLYNLEKKTTQDGLTAVEQEIGGDGH